MKVVYLRVSSEEQAEKQTIASQRDEVLKYCKAQNLQIDKIYEDEAVSAKIRLAARFPNLPGRTPGPPSGSELWADAMAGRVSEIYCQKFDRIGRKLRDYLNLRHELDRVGVRVVSVQMPIQIPGPIGRMVTQVLGAFAEMDHANILANTWRGLKWKADQFGWTGGYATFGHQQQGQQRTAHLVKHEEHAPIVLHIYVMYDAGSSLQEIADYLNNDLRLPTSRQNPGSIWRASSVRYLLRNPIYTGTPKWARRQWFSVEDEETGETTRHLRLTPERASTKHFPELQIVPQDLWDRVQAKLSENQNEKMAHPVHTYLLRSRIKCETCGRNYMGRGRYYSCQGRHCARRERKSPCASPIIRRTDVESLVWEVAELYVENPETAVQEALAQTA
jgi:site-specific DNA recombinase